MMEPPVQAQLYVEMLSRFVLFFNKNVDAVTLLSIFVFTAQITPAHISKMISVIEETLAKVDPGEEADQIRAHYNGVLTLIRAKKST